MSATSRSHRRAASKLETAETLQRAASQPAVSVGIDVVPRLAGSPPESPHDRHPYRPLVDAHVYGTLADTG